jgi:NitT/TauT family transport system substrate-binding protein
MKKKLTAVLCSAVFAAAVLAGCGQAAENQPAAASSASAVTSAAVTSSAATAATSAAQTAEAAQTMASAAVTTASGTETAASAATSTASSAEIHIMALKGPTAMGLVKFMNDADAGTLSDNSYTFSIAASPDEVSPALVQGKADIAAVPGNLASVLYNKTKGGIEVLAINTLGVLSIVDTDGSIKSVADLKGRTLYASGKGATPEYVLNYILQQNGLDPAKDVKIEWKSEHAECLSALLADPSAVAMLPQPFVTTAQMKSDKVRVALDLTKEWDSLQKNSDTPSALVMGVVCARREFVDAHPEAVKAFLEHYSDSVDYVNGNTEAAAELVGKYDIVPAAVAVKALPQCSITFIDGSSMKEKLSGFLQVLYDQNPAAVGGAVPGDDFYYGQ